MLLAANAEDLRAILELFYTLSGIRIVLFDESFNEIIAYPSEKCAFCQEIRKSGQLSAKCVESDLSAFQKSRNLGEIVIYKCHAGLIEATVPLSHGGRIIGYVMFGQITDIKDKELLRQFIDDINKKYNVACSTKGLKYRSKKQLSAAANLLEMCTEYIILKEMVVPQFSASTMLATEYISANLGKEIKIADICDYAGVSRTALYDSFSREYGIGISSYIRKKRLEYAKGLLKSTNLPVSAVSERAGFSDYNYFSRIFKKEFGISPHKVVR